MKHHPNRTGPIRLLTACASALVATATVQANEHHLAAGYAHSVATKADGTVWTWGDNTSGQLGDNTFTSSSVPVQANNVTGTLTTVRSVASGHYHVMALQTDGSVWTWGYNADGVLGNGSYTDEGLAVAATISNVAAIGAGDLHSLAVRADGTVWAWGDNTAGLLGNPAYTSANSNTPIQVATLTNAAEVDGGRYHSLARKADGTVWAWGSNTSGQLGNNTNTDAPSPVQVSGLSGVTAIATGQYHSLALRSNGTVWAWGQNFWGTLGDGTNTDKLVPTQITALSNIVAIASGDYHSLAVQSDGTVWAWGVNNVGQFGNNTMTDSNVPVKISPTYNTNKEVAAGPYHSLSLQTGTTVDAWGDNSYGELGEGGLVPYSLVPVTVSSLTGAGRSFASIFLEDNVNPATETLYAAYNFTPVYVGGALSQQRVADLTSRGLHATARNISKFPSNVLDPTAATKGISTYGFDNADSYHFSVDAKTPRPDYRDVKSLSFWMRFDTGEISGVNPIFSYVPYAATRSIPTAAMNPYTIRAQLVESGGTMQLVFRNWVAEASSVRERWTLDRNATQLTGRWFNVTFVWRGAGGGAAWAAYLDGRAQTRTIGSLLHFGYNLSAQDVFAVGAEAYSGTGATPIFTNSFGGQMDRVRLYTGEISAAKAVNIRQQDTDGDGIWDATEAPLGAARPYTVDPPLTDTDADGATDIAEQTAETDPGAP